jgi:hypothetical protein
MPFTIGDTDVTGLSLAIHRGAVVSGKVIRDENGPVQKPAGALIFLSVEKSSERDDVRSAAIAADGTFSFKARPGRYIVIGPTSTSSERLKEVFFNGKNIGDGPFTVGNDPVTGLNVALTERHTKLEGTIRPRADCTVVVFPADRSRWDAIRSNPTRARSIDVDDGAFDVSGLLPGEYFVAAVDDSLMGEWPTRTTLDRLSRLATRVHLSEGTPTRVALTIRNRRR